MSRQSKALKSLASKRAQVTARGRFLLALFVVAWVNLAVQPCLMAMESVPESVVVSGQSAHTEHASHSPDHNCDHCPPASSDHAKVCASAAASDCGSIPDYNYDGRNGLSKLEDIPAYVAIAEIAVPVEFTIPTSSPLPANCAAPNYPIEPPLNVRFCVFLK